MARYWNRDRQLVKDAADYSTEALMTCFALAGLRMYNFSQDEITENIQYISWLMDDVLLRGERTINEIASENNIHPNMLSRWKADAEKTCILCSRTMPQRNEGPRKPTRTSCRNCMPRLAG